MSDKNEKPSQEAPATGAARQTAEDRKQARRIAKEQQRLNLWRSRVHLIKEARDRFSIKDFSGSVVAYEKYFRVLEIIYEAKPNEIHVGLFNNSARAKELVVIASAYWDMVRIYDQSSRFTQRQNQCADKLIEFLPFTPVFAELIKKIEDYKKNAKNKDVFERIIKQARKKKGRCFIATAAFEDCEHPTVKTLQNYRDSVLQNNIPGQIFIGVYYAVSPLLSEVVDHSPTIRHWTRAGLNKLTSSLQRKYNLK